MFAQVPGKTVVDNASSPPGSGVDAPTARPGSGGGSTLSGVVSITDLSIRVGWLAALAVLALLLAGRRKPVRAWRRAPRSPRRQMPAIPVEHAPTSLHRQAGIFRRVFDVAALAVIAVAGGALAALVISAGVAWMVTTLTGMLS